MFYKNIETKQVVLLIKSDSKKTILFEYGEDGETTGGRILTFGKKEFKKNHIKFKKCKFQEPNENMKQTILRDYETNEYAYTNHFEEYVEDRRREERIEEIEKQTEADRRRLMKELADDYQPQKPKINKEV